MINSLQSGSQHLTISGGTTYVPYISPGAMSSGSVRYNTNTQKLEVYDGVSWHSMVDNAIIDLGHETKEVMEWAHKKMHEEKRLQELIKRHPGLKDLHDKFEMMRVLCLEEERK